MSRKEPALTEVPPFTDDQRRLIREFYAENPKGGYKRALAHACINATQEAAKAAITGDDELFEIRETMLGVTSGDALAAVGEILADPTHKDRLRAAEAALKMLHGYGEKQSLELTGADGGPVEVTSPDVADAAERFIALTAAAVRRTPGLGTDEAPGEPDTGGES
jgi:hypothetical protein